MTEQRLPADERLRHGCAMLEEDGEGWTVILCDCGYDLGQFPDGITAVDALIDHVIYEVARVRDV